MKKVIAVIIAVVMLASFCSITASATCPDHGSTNLSYWCTGTILHPGPNDSGYHCTKGHGSYCVVTRYRCYTGEMCDVSSCDWVYSRASDHLCYFTHSLGDTDPVCPY